MKKAIVATALASLLALFAFLGLTSQSAAADGGLVPGVTLPPITVTVPQIITVPVPGQTVTLPRATLTLPRRTVTVPGPVRTITVPQSVPGQSTVTVTKTVAKNGVPRPATTSGTLTVTSAPRVVTSVSPRVTSTHVSPGVTSTQTRNIVRTNTVEKPVKITVPQALGISAGLLIVGGIIGLLLLALYYTMGYKDADERETKYLQELRSVLRR